MTAIASEPDGPQHGTKAGTVDERDVAQIQLVRGASAGTGLLDNKTKRITGREIELSVYPQNYRSARLSDLN